MGYGRFKQINLLALVYYNRFVLYSSLSSRSPDLSVSGSPGEQ